ncbi:MAG: LacI family DNA-binding transcriptional regulator [Lentisphaeria bacterium]|jgi:DNA-binding LacI/PurR family transcriptional regulator|nr:LacI family DNA-binding transcriptional regulator [Lentisphaeria bacterium]MDY0176302.1 LacI family DNA-binding transcriptional regulator [Lentisphaeria bacterium]
MVTLSEISAATGFSIPVVSRVLNPPSGSYPKVAANTRALILSTARKMNYRPNRQAEFFKRGQSPVIGVFLPYYRNSLIVDIIMGLSESAQAHGFPLSFSFKTSFESYRKFIDETRGRRNCGVITYPSFQVDKAAAELMARYCEHGGKMLLLNSRVSVYNVPYVGIDDEHGGRIAAEHLLERGCQEFILSSPIDTRLGGFRAALPPQLRAQCQEFEESDEAFQRIVQYCLESNKCIGIFACADRMAARLHGMLLQAGLLPGQRVKLLGYDDLFLAPCLSPALSSVSQPFKQAAALAVEKLIDSIYAKPVKSETLKPSLVIRETT